jgi:hypothetical protein
MVEYGYHVDSLFLFKHSHENETTQVITNEISPTHGWMGDILFSITYHITTCYHSQETKSYCVNTTNINELMIQKLFISPLRFESHITCMSIQI